MAGLRVSATGSRAKNQQQIHILAEDRRYNDRARLGGGLGVEGVQPWPFRRLNGWCCFEVAFGRRSTVYAFEIL